MKYIYTRSICLSILIIYFLVLHFMWLKEKCKDRSVDVIEFLNFIMMNTDERVQNLEAEIGVLKDTVWRLTGRIFTLETFLAEKFGDVIVDFGMKMSNSYGGHASFLSAAMEKSFPSNIPRIEKPPSFGEASSRTDLPLEMKSASHHPFSKANMQTEPNEEMTAEEFVVLPQVPDFIIHNNITDVGGLSTTSRTQTFRNVQDSSNEDEISIETVPKPNNNPESGKISIKCSYCKLIFNETWRYKAHMQRHAREQEIYDPSKPFVCTFCKKRFRKKQELIVHTRIHTGEKPFTCNVCGRAFSQSSSLKTHTRIHTGERPYVCRICTKGFTLSQNLQKHLTSVHRLSSEEVAESMNS